MRLSNPDRPVLFQFETEQLKYPDLVVRSENARVGFNPVRVVSCKTTKRDGHHLTLPNTCYPR